jgi:hypothetical protein
VRILVPFVATLLPTLAPVLEAAEKMTWEELQAVKNHQDCHFDYET